MKETKYAGTQTEKNLLAAFAGESEARNKYTYFASKAKKEGYEQIAALFLKTADNEKALPSAGQVRHTTLLFGAPLQVSSCSHRVSSSWVCPLSS